MAAIKNLNGLTVEQVSEEIKHGGRFVMYQYTVSLIVVTLQRSSEIYFVRADEKSVSKGLPFTVVSLVFGWWGFPWGPIRTVGSLSCNLSGGKDVTQEVMSLMDSLDTSKRITRKVA